MQEDGVVAQDADEAQEHIKSYARIVGILTNKLQISKKESKSGQRKRTLKPQTFTKIKKKVFLAGRALGQEKGLVDVPFDAVIKEASAWLSDFDALGARKAKPKKGSLKSQAADAARFGKIELAKEYLANAAVGKVLSQLEGDEIDFALAQELLDEILVDAPFDCKAKAYDLLFGHRKATGGSSDVKLILDGSGKVAFAFKATAGESQQMAGLEDRTGAGAVRESLCSTVCDYLSENAGLDFKFPKSTVATLNGESGALIEGMDGFDADPDDIDITEGEIQELKQRVSELDDFGEVHQAAIMGMLTANFDIKWANMMFTDAGIRPMDGGAAFPAGAMVEQVFGTPPGQALCYAPDDKKTPLPGAIQPLSEKLRDSILGIDHEALMSRLTSEHNRLLLQNGELSGAILPEELQRMSKSILCLQSILKSQPNVTFADLGIAFAKAFFEGTEIDSCLAQAVDEIEQLVPVVESGLAELEKIIFSAVGQTDELLAENHATWQSHFDKTIRPLLDSSCLLGLELLRSLNDHSLQPALIVERKRAAMMTEYAQLRLQLDDGADGDLIAFVDEGENNLETRIQVLNGHLDLQALLDEKHIVEDDLAIANYPQEKNVENIVERYVLVRDYFQLQDLPQQLGIDGPINGGLLSEVFGPADFQTDTALANLRGRLDGFDELSPKVQIDTLEAYDDVMKIKGLLSNQLSDLSWCDLYAKIPALRRTPMYDRLKWIQDTLL